MKIGSLFHSQMVPFFVSSLLFIILGDSSHILPLFIIYIVSSLLIYTIYESFLIDSEDEMERIRQQYVDKEIEVPKEKET